MKKIKLTESQVAMLKELESKKRVMRITNEQYGRIFENSAEFKMAPVSMRPASKVTKDFKKGVAQIPDQNMKIESRKYSIREFARNVVPFIKEMMVGNLSENNEPLTGIWESLGVDRAQLEQALVECGLVSKMGSSVKVPKEGFNERLKSMYEAMVPMVQLGNDVELREMNQDDIKKSISKGITGEPQRTGKSPEEIQAAIQRKREEELKRREAEKNRPVGEAMGDDPYRAPDQVEPQQPAKLVKNKMFKLVWSDNESCIFDYKGKLFLFYNDNIDKNDYAEYADRYARDVQPDGEGGMDVEYDDFDVTPEVVTDFVNGEYKHLRFGKGFSDYERGIEMVEFDQSLVEEMIHTANSQIKRGNNPEVYEKLLQILGGIQTETTTAASSGAFVGKMGSQPIKRPNKPADELKHIMEDSEEILGSLKDRQFANPTFGVMKIAGVKEIESGEGKTYIIKLIKDGKEINQNMVFSSSYGEGGGLKFNDGHNKFYDPYKIFPEMYHKLFDKLKENLGTEDIQEQGIGSIAKYDTPGFAASAFFGNAGKKGKAPVNKGVTHKKTMYPQGKFVKESEVDKMSQGGQVEFDDCVKPNNNKVAINGGCSTGAVDNVVKLKESSIIELSKRTGKTIDEIKSILSTNKG